jgi:sugar lactone lactonase YvrE
MSPTTSAVIINGVTPAPATSSGPPPFVDVWAGKSALVSTLAGDGSTGIFNYPYGFTILPSGNILVADGLNNRIRSITPTGVVTTFAGDGSSVIFNIPTGVAVLSNGNIVVVDLGNHRIRLITMPGTVISTIAGNGSPAFAEGTGTSAQFYAPRGVAVLPNGNIVIADGDNHRIRLITMPDGVVSTLAGGGSSAGSGAFADDVGTNARFSYPSGIAVLPNGNLVVADTSNNRIRLVTMPAGVVTTLAGTGSTIFNEGIGTVATFNYPRGVAVLPNGNLVVADTGNHRIRLVTMTSPAVVSTLAGNGSTIFNEGIGTVATFNGPYGLTVNSSSGVIIVADQSNNRIRLITPT